MIKFTLKISSLTGIIIINKNNFSHLCSRLFSYLIFNFDFDLDYYCFDFFSELKLRSCVKVEFDINSKRFNLKISKL